MLFRVINQGKIIKGINLIAISGPYSRQATENLLKISSSADLSARVLTEAESASWRSRRIKKAARVLAGGCLFIYRDNIF
jgi:MOSC domain-containing protein YiiM